MLTGRDFLEWHWGSLKSLGHPWDWLQISAAGLSSTGFPAQPPFLLAAPVRLVCISGKWLLQERGFFKDVEDRRLGQPQRSGNIRWMNKELLVQGVRWWFSTLLMMGTGVLTELVFQSTLLYQNWQIYIHRAHHRRVEHFCVCHSVQLCKWTVCYNVSI